MSIAQTGVKELLRCLAFIVIMKQPSEAFYDTADIDGVVVHGSLVIVNTMAGRQVLALTTEQDNSLSELIEYCRRKCASNEAIPQVCVGLQWKPPVPIPSPAGFNLRQKVRLEATLVPIPIPSDDEFHTLMDDGTNYQCLVCYDPAIDLDETDIDRSVNCERCYPCTLCDNCKVNLAGVNVCLYCIEPAEVKLIDAGSCRRLNLTDCEQPVKDALQTYLETQFEVEP